jgi:hypothetical protein
MSLAESPLTERPAADPKKSLSTAIDYLLPKRPFPTQGNQLSRVKVKPTGLALLSVNKINSKMNETKESGANSPVMYASGNVTCGPSHEQIANLAYFIWMSEGCPKGRNKSNWHAAEEQLEYQSSIGAQHDPSGEPKREPTN